jgi:hypothetical protein
VLYREQRFKRFPSERWLREHGPRGLADQIKQTGGARRWARELGVPGPQPARWTDELIEIELRLLCAHKSVWPTKAEFADAGLSGLLAAVRRERQRVVGAPSRAAPAATATPHASTDDGACPRYHNARYNAVAEELGLSTQ